MIILTFVYQNLLHQLSLISPLSSLPIKTLLWCLVCLIPIKIIYADQFSLFRDQFSAKFAAFSVSFFLLTQISSLLKT